MSKLVVHVISTVGSAIREEPDGPTAIARGKTDLRDGWPVGWGRVEKTLTGNGGEAQALVLMREPALPGVDVLARPVAVLHLGGDDPVDEILCVAEEKCFSHLTDRTDLPQWHAEPEAWASALDRMLPGARHPVVGCSPTLEADHLVDEVCAAYLRATGWVD
ncbi:inorganic diphosphatase [Arthrobacter sp. 1P04PC]|uniref:inorganic diphosphatase n=1 Tax=unclassified Arthrobacter TaxID=235627 RepID=UPI0039A0808D